MALTEEQKERMRINRERALEIKKRKEEERKTREAEAEAEVKKVVEKAQTAAGDQGSRVDSGAAGAKSDDEEDDDDVELEDFEVGASKYVTKSEASRQYCLPEGTLAVCRYEERDNPRGRGWAPMKLYRRVEVRRRARERWGGMEGLRKERERREQRRFEKDMEGVGQVFEKEKKKKRKRY